MQFTAPVVVRGEHAAGARGGAARIGGAGPSAACSSSEHPASAAAAPGRVRRSAGGHRRTCRAPSAAWVHAASVVAAEVAAPRCVGVPSTKRRDGCCPRQTAGAPRTARRLRPAREVQPGDGSGFGQHTDAVC